VEQPYSLRSFVQLTFDEDVANMAIDEYEQKLLADKSIGKKKREKLILKEEKRRQREVGCRS